MRHLTWNANATRRDQQAEGKAVNAFGGNFLLAKTFVLALLRFLVAASRYTAAEIRVLCLGASLRLLRRIDYE